MSDLNTIPRLIVAEWAPDARACAAIHERVSAVMACAALDHLEAAEARAEKAEAANREWKEDAANVLAERCAKDERHCVCVVHLRAALAKAEAALAEALRDRDEVLALSTALVAKTDAKLAETEAEALAAIKVTGEECTARATAAIKEMGVALNEANNARDAEKARADKASANCAALAADALHRHVETVGGCSVCDLKTGKRCALLSTTNQGAGWVSPEEHARVVALTADEAQKHARDLAAERDAALAVKAQLLALLGRARDHVDATFNRACDVGDSRTVITEIGAVVEDIDAAIAAAKGGAT
jgi:putative hemolysin